MKRERILIICRQNVGRSQMAEGYLRSFAGSLAAISSAGVEEIRHMKKKYGNHPNPQVIAVMKEEGIDISQQKIKAVNRRMLRRATSIVVLCDVGLLPKYAFRFQNKIKAIPIEDPAPGNSSKEIPNIDEYNLRYIRDQIKQSMLGFMN